MFSMPRISSTAPSFPGAEIQPPDGLRTSQGFQIPYPIASMDGIFTHRRLRLPKVPQFRDCFILFLGFHGSSAPSNTYHTPRLGSLNFRDWFGVSWFHCTLQSTLETTFRVLNLGIGYSSTPFTKPISEPGQTKEPGRISTYIYHKKHV